MKKTFTLVAWLVAALLTVAAVNEEAVNLIIAGW